MEIGTEISQKIRSAIKAKLIELGAYVDDELPDYIMVMVANKKTQKQMADDLQLFLSHNTDRFTEWLHSLLKKLQSINTGQEPVAGKHKSKDKHKGEKRKHKTSQSDKSAKSGEPEKKRAASSSSDKGSAKPTEGATVEAKAVSSADTSEKASPATTTPEETEINISENTDEFNEENKEIEKKPESTKSASTGKPPPVKVTKSKKSTEKRHSGGKTGDVPSSSESRKKPSSAVVAVKRKYEDLEGLEEEYDPTNPAVGNVASIIRGPQRKSSVPKSLQANRSLLMKAVSDAEKSVTTAKKSEALDEPAMRSDRRPVDLSRRLKTAAGLQLISRSKRKDFADIKYTVRNEGAGDSSGKKARTSGEGSEKMRYTIKQEPITPGKGKKVSPKSKAPAVAPSRVAASALQDVSRQSVKMKKEARASSIEPGSDYDDGQYGPPLPDTRLVQQVNTTDTDPAYDEDSSETARSTSPADPITDPEIQQILDETQDLQEEAEYLFEEESKRIIQNRPTSPVTDPKFIVTLDGVDPDKYSVLPDLRESLIQSVRPELREPVSKPERPMVAVEPEQTLPPKINPPKIKPFNINLKDTDDEEETEESTEANDSPAKAIQERCRFWPACANGNACQYIHPSIPCKTFPYCKFGDKCVYIHPNCKFDMNCTRPDCPFTHSCKRPAYAAAPKVIHKVVQVPVQPFGYMPRPPMAKQTPSNVCRFFPNCTNMNCTFIHPKPCRYGISCANKAACMFQHPALPEKDKLKWSAAPKKDAPQQPEAAGKAASVK